MAAVKRNKYERERDRLEISALFLRGKSHQQITDHINTNFYTANPISRQLISREISLILKDWHSQRIGNIDQQRAAEIGKINHLEETYWDAWERSVLDAQKKTDKTVSAPDFLRTESSTTTEGQSGNPQFLAGIMSCIERRCKLLGLDAPIKQDITSDGQPIKGYTILANPDNWDDPPK